MESNKLVFHRIDAGSFITLMFSLCSHLSVSLLISKSLIWYYDESVIPAGMLDLIGWMTVYNVCLYYDMKIMLQTGVYKGINIHLDARYKVLSFPMKLYN